MASLHPSLPSQPLPDHPRFGRMFPDLPAWDPPGRNPAEKREYLWKLAETLYAEGDDNQQLPAGYTYLGQFINHDVTFDTQSSLRRPARPEQFRSKRTPRFDLDSVYGRGPMEQPYLYCRKDPFRLVLGQTEHGELDLPRCRDASTDRFATSEVDRERTALIGDPRNDDNIILSQLHLAFLRFHNARYDKLRPTLEPHLAFEAARQSTRWHYQWIVIHDFLARLCGEELVKTMLASYGHPSRRSFAFPEEPFVPVEFSLGVFRAGHSIVRTSYHLNDILEQARRGEPIAIFGPPHPKNHLGGGRELPDRWSVQWDRFVDQTPPPGAGEGWQTARRAQRSGTVDTKLAPALRELPLPSWVPARDRSLAYLTLLRGWLLGLPSGQDVAAALGYQRELAPLDASCGDPLWLYVLREAERGRNERRSGPGEFGPVGRRIAAEVVVAFLVSDPDSYFRLEPGWQPTLPQRGSTFELADFLENAGVPMTAADWDGRRKAAGVIKGLKEPVMRASG